MGSFQKSQILYCNIQCRGDEECVSRRIHPPKGTWLLQQFLTTPFRFTQFTTTVTAQPGSNYSEPLPLHFVHHRSNRSDAIPLLFIHGWPGSFLEVEKIIDGLVSPSNASFPAFHVVAPSLPGFGFSPAPTIPGFGPKAAAEAFNDLMVNQLNYTHFVVQGGDFGGITLRFLAGNHPESVVSSLSNFWLAPPNSTDLQRYYANETTPDESFFIEEIQTYENFTAGYAFIQKTYPLELAYGMTDSPVGFAMWIYNLMYTAAGPYYYFTPSEVITWSLMYWIQGPLSGFQFYKENYYVSYLYRQSYLHWTITNSQCIGRCFWQRDCSRRNHCWRTVPVRHATTCHLRVSRRYLVSYSEFAPSNIHYLFLPLSRTMHVYKGWHFVSHLIGCSAAVMLWGERYTIEEDISLRMRYQI